MYGCMYGWMDGRLSVWMDGWMRVLSQKSHAVQLSGGEAVDGWVDEWMDV